MSLRWQNSVWRLRQGIHGGGTISWPSLCLVVALTLSVSPLVAFGEDARVALSCGENSLSTDGISSLRVSSDFPVGDLPVYSFSLVVSGISENINPQIELTGCNEITSTMSLTFHDIPTSLDENRYANCVPAISGLGEGEFDYRVCNVERWGANDATLRITYSPITIDADGRAWIADSVVVTIPGVSLSSIFPAPVTMSAAGRIGDSPLLSAASESAVHLIITADALADEMARLAEYRTQCGLRSQVVTVSQIMASAGLGNGDSASVIREYLKAFHSAGGRFVLMAGDETLVPIRYLYYYNATAMPSQDRMMPSDLYYADLTGDWDSDGDGVWGEPQNDAPDLAPELLIGRLPITTAAQAGRYIDKVIAYESQPGGVNGAGYLSKSAIICADQMRDYTVGGNVIGQHTAIAQAFPSGMQIDTTGFIEAPRGDDAAPTSYGGADIIEALSGGYGVVNILAHGYASAFAARTSGYNQFPKSYVFGDSATGSGGALATLSPNGATGLYVSLSCDIGGFDLDSPELPCLVTSALCADRAGAVAMVANTRWGWVGSSYLLHREFINALWGEAMGNPARAMHLSWQAVPYYRDLIYGQSYFGDPALTIFSGAPAELSLEIDGSRWADGQTLAKVTAGGGRFAGALVTLATANTILAQGLSDENGVAQLSATMSATGVYAISAVANNATVAQETFAPSILTDVDDGGATLPAVFALGQNYPNPFNPTTTIPFALPAKTTVQIDIFDTLGRRVSAHSLGMLTAGDHEFQWNAINGNGAEVASGIYVVRVTAGVARATRMMTLLR